MDGSRSSLCGGVEWKGGDGEESRGKSLSRASHWRRVWGEAGMIGIRIGGTERNQERYV